MEDLKDAAPSSTEPAQSALQIETEVYANGVSATGVAPLPDVSPNGAPVITQEAGSATAGETSGIPAIPSATGSAATDAAAPSTSTTAAQGSADSAASTTAIPTGDAPAVAAAGETGAAPAAAAPGDISATTSAGAAELGATPVGADAGNVGASPAAGHSVSDIASSAQDASQGGDTEAAALRAEIALLQQQLTDEQANVAKWQGLYNAAIAAREPGAPAPAHRWISLLEVKLNALEHDARDELLDVARQLREAL
ncbi:hypothetical protein [Burkholderia multivorans]|uniref:hypothetical protein n=1 Tax=Burkholderia multivorans TaxID=87883 RepID=UPI001B996465|nr:hypothetical protein [Burkholderia multivorans]MBR7899923.1 hypothetical protein [Burkholderia multivorans]